MFQNNSATINDKHTFYDYGLYVTNTNPVSPPEPKEQYLEVPGYNGMIDLSEALTGYVIYNNRTITLKLGGKKGMEQWPNFMSDFMRDVHGKRVKVIFDDDIGYYYIGRARVQTDYDRKYQIATFTVTINAEPYKLSIHDSMEEWLWDPFSFLDGVIQVYSDIVVDGTKEMVLVGSEKPCIPLFIASNDMTILFEGKTYNLSEGINKLYEIVIIDKEYPITIIGNGTISISYRRGRL